MNKANTQERNVQQELNLCRMSGYITPVFQPLVTLGKYEPRPPGAPAAARLPCLAPEAFWRLRVLNLYKNAVHKGLLGNTGEIISAY
jgi:hypothetical protein